MNDKTISIYQLDNKNLVSIDVSSREREWMENTHDKYAYRCLPLAIANQHGWVARVNKRCRFVWQGENKIKIYEGDGCVDSIFGYGIITFHVRHLITLPEGYNLYITGPTNFIKPGIHALSGVYEADWSPYSFTMNWKMTDIGREIVFEEGDPFCFFFPIQRNLIEDFKVKMDHIDSDPTLKKQFLMYKESREEFNRDAKLFDKDGWQKHYFQGKYIDGTSCPFDHKTKLKLDIPKKPITDT